VRATRAVTPHQSAVLRVLAAVGAATDEELVNGYLHMAQHRVFRLPRQTASGLRTRRTELVAQGKVRRSPVDGYTASGRRARRWEVV
jgi:hypothetical protein